MKKRSPFAPALSAIAMALCVTPGAYAEDNVDVFTVEEMFALSISPDGTWVACQDYFANSGVINTKTQGLMYYSAAYPGNGNCIADNGVMVGQSALDGMAIVMMDGETIYPELLQTRGLSTFNGITANGSRACGYLTNNLSSTYAVPFYMDFDEEGNGVKVTNLPYPRKDLLNHTPQFVTAVWISDDGKTVTGQVMDSTGFFAYPIVWKEDEEGNWEYTLPSDALFNPEHYPIPEWPEYEEDPPKIYDFMTEVNRERWLADTKAYQSGETTFDPWDHIDDYMNEEEYNDYIQTSAEYSQKYLSEYYKKVDEYWAAMGKIINSNSFMLGCVTLNGAGTMMVSSISRNDQTEGISDTATRYEFFIYDIEKDTFELVELPYSNLYPKQILNDGTIVCLDLLSYCNFLMQPETHELITFDDYIKSKHPEMIPWLIENLGLRTDPVYLDLIPTGYLSFSNDNSIIAGGVLEGMGFTYVLGAGSAGIENIKADTLDGSIRVYDLSGRKLMVTKNADDLHQLDKGIYIINGKKVIL